MLPTQLHNALYSFFATEALPGEEAQLLMAPSSRNPKSATHSNTPTPSAVLIMLYRKKTEWHFALIKRNSYKGSHSAQISLPGGKMDKTDKSLLHCALRETIEEIGVECTEDSVVGEISSLYIPISNFMVHPFVAVLDFEPEFSPDTHEVKHVIEYPLEHILSADKIGYKEITSQGHHISTPVYTLDDDYIWGATAMILSEFAEIMKSIKSKKVYR